MVVSARGGSPLFRVGIFQDMMYRAGFQPCLRGSERTSMSSSLEGALALYSTHMPRFLRDDLKPPRSGHQASELVACDFTGVNDSGHLPHEQGCAQRYAKNPK